MLLFLPVTRIRKLLLRLLSPLLRVFTSFLLLFLLLFLLTLLILQFPAVQTYITGKIASSLSLQTGSEIRVERVAVRFPKSVGLKGVYMEDNMGDTLLMAGHLFADVRMAALLNKNIHVGRLKIDDLRARIVRQKPDSLFNWQFLADSFQSGEKTETPADGKPWKFHLNDVRLGNITVHYEDHYSGMLLETRLDHFQTSLGKSDLLTGKFHAGSTELTNLSFSYSDHEGTVMSLTAGKLRIIPEIIDLSGNRIGIASIQADNLHASMVSPPGNGDGEPGTPAEANHDQGQQEVFSFVFADIMDWTVSLGRLDISNSSISFRETAGPPKKDAFDPGNFSMERLSVSAENMFAAPDSLNLNILNISLVIPESFSLDRLALQMNLGRISGNIRLEMETPESRLGLSLETGANLLDISEKDLYGQTFILDMEESHIGNDLAFFIPPLRSYYFNRPGSKGMDFGGRVRGSPADIVADSLWIGADKLFQAGVRGQIRGLPDTRNLSLDMDRIRLSANLQDVMSILPGSLKPANLVPPDSIDVEGLLKGNLAEFEAAFEIYSSFGKLAFMASLHESNVAQKNFEGKLFTGSFDTGRLLKMDLLPLPHSLELAFRGIIPEKGSPVLDAGLVIGQLSLAGHLYDDIELLISLEDSVANFTTAYRDEFLSLEIDAEIGALTRTAFARGELTVDYADLRQLGLMQEEMLIATALEADILFDVDDFFNGNITVKNTNIADGKQVFNIPGLTLVSESRPGNYSTGLKSGFLNAGYNGNFTPADLPGIITGHLSEYIAIPWLSQDSVNISDKYFDMELYLYPHELISMVLMPGIEKYDTFSVTVQYDSRLHEMVLEASMESFHMTGMDFLNFRGKVSSDAQKMDFGIYLDEIRFGETGFYEAGIAGSFSGETYDISLSLKDEVRRDFLVVKSFAEMQDDLFHVSVDSKDFTLIGEKWDIHPGNRIIAGKDHLHVSNFVLENRESMLSANSRDIDTGDTIIDIIFRHLDLSVLTSFSGDSPPVIGGLINGGISVKNIFGEAGFEADLSIKDLSWKSDTISLVSLKAENPFGNMIEISATAEHQNTFVSVHGIWLPGEEPRADIDILLEKLDLPLIESFTGGNLTHLEGFVTGSMKMTGNPANPFITGELNIRETAFRVPALNAGYFLRNERISFDRQNIRLQNFILEDSLGRRAGINGNVNFSSFDNLIFNLDLSTRNFMLMNLPAGRNDMYHGHILMDSDLRLRGNHLNPSLEGRLKFNEGSSFSFLVPQSDPEPIGDEGVVEFFHGENGLFYRMAADPDRQDELVSSLERLNISLNIELDRQSEISVIIDETAGDRLELKGGGVLSFGVDPGGRIKLAGRYEIVEGQYLLTFYDVIRRNFRIRPGSNIVWTGNPLEAEIDITAIYSLRTDAQELMRTHPGADQAYAGRLRQQYPFIVYLMIKGDLMQPEISFEIDMPPEHRSALDGSLMARINDINRNESELNKQVFALLILGSFIQENPLASVGGPGIITTARSSASQILSQQLNRMSDRYIKGVDINFEIESYEEFIDGQPAGRTELQMEVSRNFFDERVRITVGGNIELEDEMHRQTSTGDIAGDFTIEYLLTPEGTLIIKGFRIKDYGDIIEGNITKTGVSLIFSRSYNIFRELFRRREEDLQELPLQEGETPLLPEQELLPGEEVPDQELHIPEN